MKTSEKPPTPEKLLKKEGHDIRQMFASIAPTYDLLNYLLSLGQDRRWRKRAVELSGLSGYKDARVLDICTGTADLAMAFSRHLGSGGRVVGSDFCWEMLALAPAKLRARDAVGSRIALVQADALRLPFPDNSFHVASVAFGIRNVSSLASGIKEMARVVMPGGRVVILEFGRPGGPFFRRIYNFYFHQVLPRVGNLIAPGRTQAYSYLPASVGEFPDPEGLRRIMESAGLVETQSHPLSMGIVYVHIGKKS
jgi:demethylmenaquinone methyltransferase/2-methoxy-6-polyprenyl-1,4-benzoquinol methylase